jgi:hypothetical protein
MGTPRNTAKSGVFHHPNGGKLMRLQAHNKGTKAKKTRGKQGRGEFRISGKLNKNGTKGGGY